MARFDTTFSTGSFASQSNKPEVRTRRTFFIVKNKAAKEELSTCVQAYVNYLGERPGIQKIYSNNFDEDMPYVDWIESDGISLTEEYCKKKKWMPKKEVLNCLRQIIVPLILMHDLGIVHNNIRPDTIHVTIQDSRPRKSQYMLDGPDLEKFDIDSDQFSKATDVYALALTLYILYTGRSPFDAVAETSSQIFRQPPEEAPTLHILPKPLRPIFQQALSKNPGDRPTLRNFYTGFVRAYQQIITRKLPQQLANIAIQDISRRQAIKILVAVMMLLLLLAADKFLSLVLGWPRKLGPMASRQAAHIEVPIGVTILTYRAHKSTVNAAHPSPDGSMVLSADAGGRLMVWASHTGKVLLNDSQRHAKTSIIGATWASNNQAFASLDKNGLVWLWRLQDGTFMPFASHHFPMPTEAIAWSSVGDHLLVASGSCVEVYNGVLKNGFGLLTADYAGHDDTVNSVAISYHSKFAASGSNDNTTQMWIVKTAKQLYVYPGHTDDVLTVAISPDERYIASGGEDQSVQVWDAEGDIGGVQFANRHNGTVRSVAWSSDSQHLASGGDDKVVNVWHISGKLCYPYNKHKSAITSVAWLGNNVVSASSNEVHIWRAV